ncbi:inhibin beta chain [Phlebotomus argentipes]|uniref:inhibin beta chain n=1 Tax=Phlebotomus argentipes TaxID=94469 RepID=UPI0028932AA5|nr:inhibin beta chain [Phlebotomus argentipes]XP_059609838.1 inhibin beta chain [Phlebotomus argentipes]XP_059609839.1 inhibin beta chain [Phlebotomus argentipes]XP_059609840.1 inhibin beta chain [Phlebotomus argentipes]
MSHSWSSLTHALTRHRLVACLIIGLICGPLTYARCHGDCRVSPKCRHCRSTPTDALRLDAIKQQILTKLGMASPPNLTHALPKQLAMDTLFRAQEPDISIRRRVDEPDDFYGRTQEIIEFADRGGVVNGQHLLEFSTNQDQPATQELRVRTATLWIRLDVVGRKRKRRSIQSRHEITLWIFQLLEAPHNTSRTFHDHEFDRIARMSATSRVALTHASWHKVDVTLTVRRWFAQIHAEPLRFLVDCSGCRGRAHVHSFGSLRQVDPHRPFLVLHTDPNTMRRVRRRALDCSGAVRGQCCKQRFYVSFKALGWDDWIIAPHGYFANYCRGECAAPHRTPDTFLTYYTHIIDEFRKMNKLIGMQPCCAPLKFSSMSLIYFGPDHKIIKRDLPKMVVDECGCP